LLDEIGVTMQRACIGVDVGGSKIHVGVVDRDGQILAARLTPTAIERGVSAVVETIGTLAEQCIEEAHAALLAVGVGIAGQIDTRAGVVRSSPNLTELHDVALAPRLSERLRCPVILTNDLRAIARGEWRFGAGRGVSDLVVMFIGTGVGGAVIVGDRPLVGVGGYAGELGHMPIVANGRKCHCPGRGCVEAYVSGWALAERTAALLALHPEHAPAFATPHDAPTARELADAFAAGDKLAEAIVIEAAEHLGAALVGITNAFNPARIVVGGGVIEGLPDLLELARNTLQRDSIVVSYNQVEIAHSKLGSEAGVIGAATWAWDELSPR
jgi:glucokinase